MRWVCRKASPRAISSAMRLPSPGCDLPPRGGNLQQRTDDKSRSMNTTSASDAAIHIMQWTI